MKVGDSVYSTKHRQNDRATIVKVDVDIRNEHKKKSEVRSKYIAKYLDGEELVFYGFNINKSIFKVMEPEGQYSIFDYL